MGCYAITGGASGIGSAISAQLRDQNHKVIVVDIQNADVVADLATSAGREQAVEGVKALATDGLDGFIPCAGIGVNVKPPSLIARINYFGALATIEGLKELLAKKQGSIVLISSISATMKADAAYVDTLLANDEPAAIETIDALGDGNSAYAGGKQALTRWMRRNCSDYLAQGVRMNAVAPGYISTPLNEKIEAVPELHKVNEAFADSIPLGRRGMPEDIANVVCFLLSEKSAFVAGAVLLVDGGHDAMFRPDQF